LEFSRPVEIDRLPPGMMDYDIAALASERQALAARFSLLALDRLEARVRLERLAGGLWRLSATLSADVVQECVVTLEPVASTVIAPFTLLFGEAPDPGHMASAEAEPVEAIVGRVVDVGEAVAQQLSLTLDPYPRSPGVGAKSLPEPPALGSAFDALAKWKKKR
jgi:uncharacterized metal-binding protein YceD (DUF177 family)